MKILISTCCRYIPSAKLVVDSIRRANCSLPIVVVCEDDRALDALAAFSGVDVLRTPYDMGWQCAIMHALESSHFCDATNVLVTMDDLAFTSGFDPAVFALIEAKFLEEGASAMKLYEPPSTRISTSISMDFQFFNECCGARYPISCMLSIFDISFLKRQLSLSSSAWDFELRSSSRLVDGDKVMSLGFNLVNLSNIVIKGAVATSRFNYWFSDVSSIKLPVMSKTDELRHWAYISASFCKNFRLRNFFRYLYL